ncbi:MAG: glutamyl-tRNA reductase [Verrucomicrobiota bacterium]
MSSDNSRFLLLSINHEHVPLEERESYSVNDDKLRELYRLARESAEIEESLVLSTCNRFELYAKSTADSPQNPLTKILADLHQIDCEEIESHAITEMGQEAVTHLIEVSAGLRSQITGEAEILGQVKQAYAKSQELGGAGKLINRVAQKAFQAAKQIRHNTPIGQGTINISNVAVDLSLKIFGDLNEASVLVLGTGEIGEKTAQSLMRRGAKKFGVASRSIERATAFAAPFNAKPHASDNLASYLPEYDIIIAGIGVKEAIITKDLVRKLKPDYRDNPLFLIDLGLPRNIDPKCEDFDNVYIYNLDDLAKISEDNLAERRKAISASREIALQKSSFIWQNLQKRGLI